MNICICQLIKDEQRYIEEWIEYHLNLGISKFILFEDWNSTPHDEILTKYVDKIILHKVNDIISPAVMKRYHDTRQKLIWKYFFEHYRDVFDCCLFIDPDEYLICNKEDFLEEVEKYYNDKHVKFIQYVWQTMTASGHIKDPFPNQKYSIMKTYTNKMEHDLSDLNWNHKPLIYLKKIHSYKNFKAPHDSKLCERSTIYSLIKLNHYLTKSWEEYKWRLSYKGELLTIWWTRKLEDFFEINTDLLPYKEQLLNECKDFKYKYNDYI